MSSKDIADHFFHDLPTFGAISEFEEHLCKFLGSGIQVHWEAGRPVFGFTRAQVDRLHGLTIEIRIREHAPPHFHVLGNGIDAAFNIVDGTQIAGKIDRSKADLVQVWWSRSRSELIRVWNATRPDKCPVGQVLGNAAPPNQVR